MGASTMQAQTRKRKLIEPGMQWMLVLRGICYWLAAIVILLSAAIVYRMFFGAARPFYTHFEDLWFHYGTPLLAATALLPLFVWDVVRQSNRIAGPVHRLRISLRNLANGEPIRLLQFRVGDYWQELADDYNAVASRMELLQRQVDQLNAKQAREAAVARPCTIQPKGEQIGAVAALIEATR